MFVYRLYTCHFLGLIVLSYISCFPLSSCLSSWSLLLKCSLARIDPVSCTWTLTDTPQLSECLEPSHFAPCSLLKLEGSLSLHFHIYCSVIVIISLYCVVTVSLYLSLLVLTPAMTNTCLRFYSLPSLFPVITWLTTTREVHREGLLELQDQRWLSRWRHVQNVAGEWAECFRWLGGIRQGFRRTWRLSFEEWDA